MLDKIWDDVMAGPHPQRGLGKLRKINPNISVAVGGNSYSYIYIYISFHFYVCVHIYNFILMQTCYIY
jgi:hypothetical protein